MIRILLSEKASQTLNSMLFKVCCVYGQTEAACFISRWVIAFVQLDCHLLYLFVFEVYFQHVFEL